ncbi:MAG: cytidine deaminase [Gemmatimonadota bacterium]
MTDPEVETLIAAARAIQGTFALSKPDLKIGAVAAALRTRSGAVHTGVCLDLACGVGFCAEHAAIAEMLKHREREIAAIVALNDGRILSPCGRCRELMLQLTPLNRGTIIVLPGRRLVALEELLPEYWLGEDYGP